MGRKETRITKPIKGMNFSKAFTSVTNTNGVLKDVSEKEFEKKLKEFQSKKSIK